MMRCKEAITHQSVAKGVEWGMKQGGSISLALPFLSNHFHQKIGL